MSAKTRFLNEFPRAVADDAAAIFIGAGISVGAGYPSWKDLLREIGDELGVNSNDVSDLAALAQWSVRKSAGRTRINSVIKSKLAPEKPIPQALETIARLPIRNIWTTNYDRLIERAFSEIGRPLDPVSVAADLSTRLRPGAVRLFKMHGSVDQLNSIVIATDDYELYRLNRGPFLPLLQAHMTSFSMLFLGLSFTDPNIRHVLSLIRESFMGSPPEHFAIVRPPQRAEYKTSKEYKSRLIQHNLWAEDLLRYGLHVVEINDFVEVPLLMTQVERQVARKRVWMSGSWPHENTSSSEASYVSEVASTIGQMLGEENYSLVSGSGLTVGPASISGFLNALQRFGSWDLERRLLVRPFPQSPEGEQPNKSQWQALREEMARISGSIILVGGAKFVNGRMTQADGVRAEMEIAAAKGAYIIPVGATGGMARAIAEEILSKKILSATDQMSHPSAKNIKALLTPNSPAVIAAQVKEILRAKWRD